MSNQKLYLIRAKIGGESKLPIFLEKNIVAIGWEKLGSLEGKSKEEITKLLKDHEYKAANIVIGQINHFINDMHIGDFCLIPDPNSYKVYLAKIVGNYYFDQTSKEYPHQYQVNFFSKKVPLDRRTFSCELSRALKPLMTVADITHRLEALNNYLEGKESLGDIQDEDNKKFSNCRTDKIKNLQVVKKELFKLLPTVIRVLKDQLESDDKKQRIEATEQIIKLTMYLDKDTLGN